MSARYARELSNAAAAERQICAASLALLPLCSTVQPANDLVVRDSADTEATPLQQRPPRLVIYGGLMLPLGAGIACAAALLAFGTGIGGATGLAAFFGALAVLGLLAAVVGMVFLAVGSVWWAITLRREKRHQRFSRIVVVGLVFWAAAIATGIAVSAGLGRLRYVGYALMIVSFCLWFFGAVFLAIGSYFETHRSDTQARTPEEH